MSELSSSAAEQRVERVLVRRLRDGVPDSAILGVGVDLVEVDSFQARLAGREDLISRLFTEAELEYSRSRKRPWLHLAARFASKEAFFKALGTGLTDGLSWLDVEVTRDEAGEPGLVLRRAAQASADRRGLGHALLSLAHGRTYAIAVVVLLP